MHHRSQLWPSLVLMCLLTGNTHGQEPSPAVETEEVQLVPGATAEDSSLGSPETVLTASEQARLQELDQKPLYQFSNLELADYLHLKQVGGGARSMPAKKQDPWPGAHLGSLTA